MGEVNNFNQFNFRCCMCQNIETPSSICQGIEGTPHPEPSTCRFVKSYMDEGSKIFVRSFPSPDHEPRWAIVRSWPQPDGSKVYLPLIVGMASFDVTQQRLNNLANERKWMPFYERRCRVCGCTEDCACTGGCYWVERDLCSNCAEGSEG